MRSYNRISELRNLKKESQATLAKNIHVSPSAVGMWETGKRAIKDIDLITLADYFDVSIDYLLGRDASKEDAAIDHNLCSQLPEDQIKEIKDYIEFKKQQYRKN